MSDSPAELLPALSGAAAAYASRLANVDAAAIAHQPAPGKWSAGEVIAHLAETEIALSVRLRMILTADHPPLAAFDQDAWAAVGHYASRPVESWLALFGALREANTALLARLTPAQWARSGVHSERGPLTLLEIATFMVWHDERHLAQVERALEQAAKP